MILYIYCARKSSFWKSWLIQVKAEGFSEGCQGCSEGFPVGEVRGKFQGAALPAKENQVHPDAFTWIYILFKLGHLFFSSSFFLNFQIMMFEEA